MSGGVVLRQRYHPQRHSRTTNLRSITLSALQEVWARHVACRVTALPMHALQPPPPCVLSPDP
eukprot:2394719-Prymnesium_polylepis.3